MAADPSPQSYREIWESKPILRAIYQDFYRRISTRCTAGRTLEIGGGSGNLKSWLPSVVSTDIVPAGWLDVVADAQSLPFASQSFDNIVLVDVLHHIPRPKRFFGEAIRVLRPGGRILLVEPGITPISRLFYGLFHQEGLRMDVDALSDEPLSSDSPLDANQAIPTLLFWTHRRRLEQAFPELSVIEFRWLSLFAYPLSGGFKPWQLIPTACTETLLRLEDKLLPSLGALMAFRLIAVAERR